MGGGPHVLKLGGEGGGGGHISCDFYSEGKGRKGRKPILLLNRRWYSKGGGEEDPREKRERKTMTSHRSGGKEGRKGNAEAVHKGGKNTGKGRGRGTCFENLIRRGRGGRSLAE